MSKEAILESFGKYLNSMSHLWNEAYCQNNYADQDRLVAIQIGKYIQKIGFQLQPQDRHQVGVRIPFFSEAMCYRALYVPECNPFSIELFNEILSSPTKANLITLGRDISNLSTEDAELLKDIMDKLGDLDESSRHEEEEEEAQLHRQRKPLPPLSPPFIPSPQPNPTQLLRAPQNLQLLRLLHPLPHHNP